MNAYDKAELKNWVRHLELDEGRDGVGRMLVVFNDYADHELIYRIYERMTHDDAKELVGGYVLELSRPCEDALDDWNDPESGFGVAWGYHYTTGDLHVRATFRV